MASIAPLFDLISFEHNHKPRTITAPQPHTADQVPPEHVGPRHTWGSFICSCSCETIAGTAPVIEAESDRESACCLNEIWQEPRHRPTLLFYDRECKRRTHLRLHPDPTWEATIDLVERSGPLPRFARSCGGCLNH